MLACVRRPRREMWHAQHSTADRGIYSWRDPEPEKLSDFRGIQAFCSRNTWHPGSRAPLYCGFQGPGKCLKMRIVHPASLVAVCMADVAKGVSKARLVVLQKHNVCMLYTASFILATPFTSCRSPDNPNLQMHAHARSSPQHLLPYGSKESCSGLVYGSHFDSAYVERRKRGLVLHTGLTWTLPSISPPLARKPLISRIPCRSWLDYEQRFTKPKLQAGMG